MYLLLEQCNWAITFESQICDFSTDVVADLILLLSNSDIMPIIIVHIDIFKTLLGGRQLTW